jgi:hypothetical protein
VIFKTELRSDADIADYHRSNRRMHETVAAMSGFISIKGYSAADGEEIRIARFRWREALEGWRTSRSS